MSMLFVDRVNLQQVSIKNPLSVVYTLILMVFLPDTYKIGLIYTFVNRCFRICSSRSMFHQQLKLLREIFQKNGYLENFIDRCLKWSLKKRFLQLKRSLCNQSFLIQKLIHWKLRLNRKSPSKGRLTAVNYRLLLKVKINSVIIFALKILFPKFLDQVWFISFTL